MAAKSLFKKFIIIIPTSLFLLNLAFADGDYTDYSSDQTEYTDTTDESMQPTSNKGSEPTQDEATNNTVDDTDNTPSDNNTYYDEDEYN